MKKKILLGLLGLFVLAQFFRIDRTLPESDPKADFAEVQRVPGKVSEMIRNACYDCHSNQTEYPWYTHITPVGQWVQGHIRNGRKKLNFSEWDSLTEAERHEALEESAEEIEEKHMPLKSYAFMHPKAQLSEAQRLELLDWLSSF